MAQPGSAKRMLVAPFLTPRLIFKRTQTLKIGSNNTIVVAAPSQVVADLMTSPGPGPQEAQALVERMKGTEDEWRQKP
jgi:hypothetical protein